VLRAFNAGMKAGLSHMNLDLVSLPRALD